MRHDCPVCDKPCDCGFLDPDFQDADECTHCCKHQHLDMDGIQSRPNYGGPYVCDCGLEKALSPAATPIEEKS